MAYVMCAASSHSPLALCLAHPHSSESCSARRYRLLPQEEQSQEGAQAAIEMQHEKKSWRHFPQIAYVKTSRLSTAAVFEKTAHIDVVFKRNARVCMSRPCLPLCLLSVRAHGCFQTGLLLRRSQERGVLPDGHQRRCSGNV